MRGEGFEPANDFRADLESASVGHLDTLAKSTCIYSQELLMKVCTGPGKTGKNIYAHTTYMYIPYRKRGGVVRRSRRAHNPKTNGSNPFLAMFFVLFLSTVSFLSSTRFSSDSV